MSEVRDKIMASHSLRLAQGNLENFKTNLDSIKKSCPELADSALYADANLYFSRLDMTVRDLIESGIAGIADYNREKEKALLSKGLST